MLQKHIFVTKRNISYFVNQGMNYKVLTKLTKLQTHKNIYIKKY